MSPRTDPHVPDPNATVAHRPDAPSTVDVTGDYVPAPSTEPAANGRPTDLPAVPGYELTGVLGRGGMSVVYAARDPAFGREVAVKLLLPSRDPDEAARRFRREAAITGRLAHPGIPPAHQTGTLPDGSPFLVMKRVGGRTLAELLKARPDPTADRPRLVGVFEAVCQAVGYAHSRGVVHRDLKPANVMVGEFGEVQVMDWGLAKDQSPFSREAEPSAPAGAGDDQLETRSGQAMGTPAYMAPEQARGEPVDARADVFALGGVLLEVLTGRRPFVGASSAEVVRKAAAGEVADALAALAGCGADRELIELATRCLSPAAADRPADGTAVADAVAAYRAGVDERLRTAEQERAAAEATAREQAKRRRTVQRWAGAVGGVLLLGIATTSAGVVWADQERRAAVAAEREKGVALIEKTAEEREKTKALGLAAQRLRELEEERQLSVSALIELTDEVVETNLARRSELTAADRAFLRRVLALWERVAAARGDGPAADALKAEGAYRVGSVRQRLGEAAEAEVAHRVALAGYQKLAADFPERPDYRRVLSSVRTTLGDLLNDAGRVAEAEAMYRPAIPALEKLAAEVPTRPEYRRAQAATRVSLGTLLESTGRTAEAETTYRAALEGYQKLAAEFPARSDYQRQLAVTQSNLGNLLAITGRTAEAETAYRAALTARVKLAAEFPAQPDYLGGLATTRINLGALLLDTGRAAEAEAMYRPAIPALEKLAAEFPTRPDYRQELARGQSNLGMLLHDTGRAAAAEAAYRAAHAIQERLAAEFPARPDYRQELARTHTSLGILLTKAGRAADAEAAHRAALAAREELAAAFPAHPEYRVDLGGSYCNFGVLVRDNGRPGESLSWFAKAIAALAPVHAADPRQVAHTHALRNSHWGRAAALDRLGRYADAVADWDRAIELSVSDQRAQFVPQRVISLLNAGQTDRAVAELDAVAAPPQKWSADKLYSFARIYATASGKAQTRRAEYADRAMDSLRKAVAAGYRNAVRVWRDPVLDPLRSRPDFQRLLADLGAAREPAPKPRPAK